MIYRRGRIGGGVGFSGGAILVGGVLAAGSAHAAPGDFTLTFTQTRPVQDGAAGICGETENYVVLFDAAGAIELAQSNDKMNTDDHTFCIGCVDELRLVQNSVFVTGSRDPLELAGQFQMELRDQADAICGGGIIDFVPGPETRLNFQVDFIDGSFIPLDPSVFQLPSGEFCVTDFPAGSGLCWIADVEPLPVADLVCGASQTCGLPEDQSGFVQEVEPGVFVSQLDNPRPSSFLVLGPGEEASRTGSLGGAAASTTIGFALDFVETTIAPDGTQVGSLPLPDRTFVLNRNLSEFDTVFGSLYVEGSTMPFETAGLLLTHNDQIVSWEKRALPPNPIVPSTPVGEVQTWRVHEDTIIVPVDVIELFPEDEPDPRFGIGLARGLIDEPDGFLATSPDAATRELHLDAQFPRVADGHGGLALHKVDQFLRPDGIYAQCGIQFRLRSYTAMQIPGEIYHEGGQKYGGPSSLNPECRVDFADEFNGAEQCLGTIQTDGCTEPRIGWGRAIQSIASASPRLDLISHELLPGGAFLGGVRAILSGRIGQCGSTPTQGFSDPSTGWAAVATESAEQFPNTLSHEIGHVLLGSGNSEHSADVNELMAAMGQGTRISGCDSWSRTNPATPFNCLPVASAQMDCEKMRNNARGRSVTRSPFTMESGPLSTDWTYGRPSYGNAETVSWSEADSTEGREAIQVPPAYTDVSSPIFKTADVYVVGSQMSVDVYIPNVVADPWWVGTVALTFASQATSTWSWLGQQDLTPLPRGAWSTLTFDVPPEVQAILLGDTPAAQFIVTTNTPSTGLLLDGLRFSGPLTQRTMPHRPASTSGEVETSALLSFEQMSDWSSSSTLSLDPIHVTDGLSSLAVQASGWTIVTSRWFSTSEVPTPTDDIGVDVFVPYPQANPWWTGELRLELTCPTAGIYNAFIGNRSLTNLFLDEFNHVSFDVPPGVKSALEEPGSCQARLILNVMNDAGQFRLDRLGFE